MDHQAFAQLLGNYGEFVGAIAVVVTLFYLAIQVRHSKEATEANTRQMEENRRLSLVENYMRRSERVEAGYKDAALSNELSELNFKAYTDPASLNEFERFRLREWSHAHMHRLDAQYFQYQHGLLEDEVYQNLRKVLKRFAPVWAELDVLPSRQSFQDEINNILGSE
jgi:hypothetical protein